MARRQKYNALMPSEVAGKPMPLKTKLDKRWRMKVFEAGMADDAPSDELINVASKRLWEAAAHSMVTVGNNQTALLLLNMAETIAGSPRDGRPKGAYSRYTSGKDERCIKLILELDDGSRGARGRAIAKAVAEEYSDAARDAAKRRLRRKLRAMSINTETDNK